MNRSRRSSPAIFPNNWKIIVTCCLEYWCNIKSWHLYIQQLKENRWKMRFTVFSFKAEWSWKRSKCSNMHNAYICWQSLCKGVSHCFVLLFHSIIKEIVIFHILSYISIYESVIPYLRSICRYKLFYHICYAVNDSLSKLSWYEVEVNIIASK